MTKWITSHLGILLLVVLTIITVGPLIAVWWATRELTWANTLPITAVAGPWVFFLYQRNATIRGYITNILAAFSSRDTFVSAQVRFGVPEDIDYAQIEQKIRDYYAESVDASSIHTVKSPGQVNIDVAGWHMRLELNPLVEGELEDGEALGRQDLLITVPETLNDVPGAKRLMSRHILPLLNQLQEDIGTVQAAELKIRFEKGNNPFLSMYFQNLDVSSIVTLRCVVEARQAKGKVILAADTITISAPDLLTLSSLASEHLVMFRASA